MYSKVWYENKIAHINIVNMFVYFSHIVFLSSMHLFIWKFEILFLV